MPQIAKIRRGRAGFARLAEALRAPRAPTRGATRAADRPVNRVWRAAPAAEHLEGRTLLSGVYYIRDATAVVEADPGYTSTLTYRVDWVGSVPTEPGAIIVTTSNGTASAAEGDYVHRETVLQFPANGGEPRFRTFTVTVNGDSRDEPDETVIATLSMPGPAFIADATAVGTIVEDDDVRPYGHFQPVSPNPRASPVESVAIAFSEYVYGIDPSDFTLTRDGGPNLLTAAQTFATTDNQTFVLGNLSGLTGAAGASYELRLRDDPATTWINDGYNNDLAFGAVTNWTTLPGDADPDDQISEAIPAGNGPVEAALARGDNVDMYKVVVAAGDAGRFDVRSNAGVFEIVLFPHLRLFNAAGTELASDAAAFNYTFPAAGTYYVGVSETGNDYNPVNGADPVSTRGGGKYLLTVAGLTRVIGPVGGEFRVNTYTPSWQRFPATAMDDDGDFVVVWQSHGQDEALGTSDGVYGQRYNAAGAPQGAEFLVAVTTFRNQEDPTVAMDAAGNFVVAWESPDVSEHGIFARRFNAAGTALGGEFPVNTTKPDFQTNPTIAMDDDGDFVVAWESSNQLGTGNLSDVFAQRYSKTGVPVGTEFRANTKFDSQQRFPTAAMDAAGNFLIAWESTLQDPHPGGNSTGIYAQLYDAAGATRGGEFRINAYTVSDQNVPVAAMDADGDFVVVWQGYDLLDGNGVHARRFNAAGAAQGGDLLVNTTLDSFQRYAAVAMDADGDFVVSWQNEYGDANQGRTSVDAQRYSAGGARVGPEFRVNTTTLGNHRHPATAMDADGDFVIAWASYGQDPGDSANTSGVYAQRYGGPAGPAGPATVSEVFVRGSSWPGNDNSATNTTFMEYLEARAWGDDVYGYRLFGNGSAVAGPAANPEQILPWINLDQIVVRYSAAPTGTGVPTPGTLSVSGQRNGAYTVTAVNAVPGDPTAFVLTLGKPLGGGNLTTGAAPTANENGDRITLSVPGAGAGGSAFSMGMKVVQGDVDHQGESAHNVLARDYAEVKKRFFKNPNQAPSNPDTDYTPFHDVDGNGQILARDYAEVKKRFFHNLPTSPAVEFAPPTGTPGTTFQLDTSVTRDLFGGTGILT